MVLAFAASTYLSVQNLSSTSPARLATSTNDEMKGTMNQERVFYEERNEQVGLKES